MTNRAPSVRLGDRFETDSHAWPRGRLVLFVHGFNVDEYGALERYGHFLSRLRRVSHRLADSVAFLFWPSKGCFPVGVACYPVIVRRVAQVAPSLSEFIEWTQTADVVRGELVVIAHSLGCRLVLEALKHIDRPPPNLRLILMAAAVPTHLMKTGKRLGDLLRAPKAFSGNRRWVHAHVLYSGFDGVLRFVFPLGESLVLQEWHALPEAVGLHGGPDDGPWSDAVPMGFYLHGSYWKDRKRQTTRAVAEAVGLPIARRIRPRRPPRMRNLGTRPDPEERQGPGLRPIRR